MDERVAALPSPDTADVETMGELVGPLSVLEARFNAWANRLAAEVARVRLALADPFNRSSVLLEAVGEVVDLAEWPGDGGRKGEERWAFPVESTPWGDPLFGLELVGEAIEQHRRKAPKKTTPAAAARGAL